MLVNGYLFKLLNFSTKQERYLDSYDKEKKHFNNIWKE